MLGKDTIIIIAVSAAVTFLILLLVFITVVKKASSTSNPLPPVQPLAHHRVQQVAKFEGSLPRSQTWYGSQAHLVPPQSLGTTSSRVSLIGKHSSPVDSESAASYSPVSDNQPLPVPTHNHSFNPSRPASSASLASADPSPTLDPPVLPRVRSLSSAARRPRPLSVSSSHSTIYSKNSRHTLRGTPHGPHSQIQIVLPAPLASELGGDTSSRRISRFDGEGYDRTSIVDKWLSPGTTTPEEVPLQAAKGPARRSMSNPSLRPPVPRVPSMYIVAEKGEGIA